MEELQWNNGDLVPDGAGGFCRLEGSRAMIQRVLFKLTARRGSFPFLPRLGSNLHLLSREKPAARAALCDRYVRQALEDEDVTVTEVSYDESGEQARVTVWLNWQGRPLEIATQIGGISNENG